MLALAANAPTLQLKRSIDHPWIAGVTVTEVKGHGRQRGHPAIYRGAEYTIDFVPKLKVEIVVPDPPSFEGLTIASIMHGHGWP